MIELTIYANVFLLSVRYNIINRLSGLVGFMVFNATFNNISVISWRSVILVVETGVPVEND